MGAKGKPKTPGSGRPKGGKNKATILREQGLVDPEAPLEVRDRMAIAAAPYCHPRLQSITDPTGTAPGVLKIERIERVVVDPLASQAAEKAAKTATPDKDWFH